VSEYDPVDYASLVAAGKALVPDYVTQQLQRQMGQAQVQQAQLENVKAAADASEDLSFHHDLTQTMLHPSADNVSALIMRHPKYAEQIKTGWDVQDKTTKDADFHQQAQIYSAAAGGYYDQAAASLQTRLDAEKAGGLPVDPADEAILTALKSKDPVQQKAVVGTLAFHMAAANPDKMDSILGALDKDKGFTLGQGETRYDENGKPIASVAAKPDYLVIPQGGKAVPLNAAAAGIPTEGGDPASTGAPPATGGGKLDPIAFFHQFVAPHEGGYAAHDANGAPVNHGINQSANPGVDVANLSTDDAAKIFADKYFKASGAADLPPALAAVHADTSFINPKRAQQFLASSGGDPAKYMQLRQAWMGSLVASDPAKYGKYAKAWGNRNRDLSAYAAQVGGDAPQVAGGPTAHPGDAPGTIYGSPVPQARTLTAAEAEAKGLDSAKVYEQKPDGSMSAVGDATADESLPGNTNLTGPAYFNSLPKGLQPIIRTIVDGRFPISAKMTSPNVIKYFKIAAVVDPSIDASTYQRRVATQRDFSSGGKSGQALTSARTVINHLYNIAYASEKIGGVGFTPANELSNWWKRKQSDPELQHYLGTLTPLSMELPKFLGGKAPTIHDIAQTREDFSPDKGPGARRAQIGTTLDLMNGRFDPIVQAYAQGMNKNSDITELLSQAPNGSVAAAKLRALQNYAAGGHLDDVKGGSAKAAAPPKLPAGAHPVGTYQGKTVYQWRDTNGQPHRAVAQ